MYIGKYTSPMGIRHGKQSNLCEALYTHESSHHEKVGTSQHENRGGRFGLAVSWRFRIWRMVFRSRGPGSFVSVPTWYNLTYLDLHFVCKICVEKPRKRQTNLYIGRSRYIKHYNSRTSHFFSVLQNIIRHHNSISFQLRNFIGPGVGHESTQQKRVTNGCLGYRGWNTTQLCVDYNGK